MARSTTFQVQSRQVVGTLEDQHKYDLPTLRRLGVAAEPLNMEVKPAKSDAMKLAEALAEAKPELNQISAQLSKEHGDNEEDKGVTAGLTSGDLDYDKAVAAVSGEHPRYIAGFMRSKGFVTGERLSDKIKEDFLSADTSEVDAEGKPTFDVNKWVSNWWKENTKGLSHPQFLAGMNKVMSKSIAEVTNEWDKQTLALADAQREGLWQDFLGGDMKAEGWSADHFGSRVQDWLKSNGGSYRDVTRYTTNMAKVAVENGDVDTVEKLMSLKNYQGTDGVKPFQKLFADDLHQVSKAASNFGLAIKAKREGMNAKVLEELDSELTDIALKGTSGDTEGARAALDKLKTDTRFRGLGFEKIIQLNNVFQNAFKKEDTREAQLFATELYGKILTGKAGSRDVIQAMQDNRIGYTQAHRLLAEISKEQAANKTLAASERASAKLELQSLRATMHNSVIGAMPRDIQTYDDNLSMDYHVEVANLERSFFKELTPDVLKDTQKANLLVKNYQTQAKELYGEFTGRANADWSKFKPTLYSQKEAEDALRSGKISTKAYRDHLKYFQWYYENSQKKAK